jgi:hypothetical protein
MLDSNNPICKKNECKNNTDGKEKKMNENDLLLSIVDELINTFSANELATELNIAVGTLKRWIKNKKVPPLYRFDLMKLNNMEIDYSKYSYKDKDQFFTKKDTAKYCFDVYLEKMKELNENETEYYYIEPSAGSGTFLKVLPKDRTIALDIEPLGKNIKKQDYLEWKPENKTRKYIVFGNPPFGLRGHLALKFINHSAKFADFVCFILPQLFESDGKGVPRKRVKGYNLIHSEKLDDNTLFTEPSGKTVSVKCIFQIWSKYHKSEEYTIKPLNENIIKVYSVSDGGTPSTTRNKHMWYKCDIFIPSTCFGASNMKPYDNFDILPRRKGYGIVFKKDKKKNLKKFKETDWSKVAFLSTNSAYNIRVSKIVDVFN